MPSAAAGETGAGGAVTVSSGAIVRLALLVLLTVVLQLAVVSQFTFLGANADLMPLVVAVGRPARRARSPARSWASRRAWWRTWRWCRRSASRSLLLTGVGYLAGRYRELRDATHKLVPDRRRRRRDAGDLGAFSIVQFLLGVDSSVSPLVIRDILVAAS